MQPESQKQVWSGTILGIQPRIRLTRSFDEQSHSYLGYVLTIQGTVGGLDRSFVVAVGNAAQAKFQFQAGDRVSGEGVILGDPRREVADLYKVSRMRVLDRSPAGSSGQPPPWQGVPPPLTTYRERGHRRLDARTYATRCESCIWGCKMAVEMIIDQWNPSKRRYRVETFCFGPLSCSAYKAGPTRKVPGRKGMSWEEEDWVDAENVRHRRPDD